MKELASRLLTTRGVMRQRFFALVKEFRQTAFKCDKCGPVVYETAVAFSPASTNWIRDELHRLTLKYHQDKPILGMIMRYFQSIVALNLYIR